MSVSADIKRVSFALHTTDYRYLQEWAASEQRCISGQIRSVLREAVKRRKDARRKSKSDIEQPQGQQQ